MLSFINKIGKNNKLAIFGTGWLSELVVSYLKRLRPDLTVAFYIDSYRQGELNGCKIYSPAELIREKDSVDTVIISSYSERYLCELYCDLSGIKNKISITKEDFVYLHKIKADSICDIFHTDNDKALYRAIVEYRMSNNYSFIHNFVKDKLSEKIGIYLISQYFDFINREAISTVLDGGACNLIHSLLFKQKFPNCKKIYAFEPSYEITKNNIYDKFVKMDDTIEIVNKGLWKQDAKLTFREDVLNPTGSNIVDVNVSVKGNNDSYKTIDVVSIDSFVKQKNIEKLDYIKLDIENAEYDVLLGAMNTIRKHRPQLAVSIYHTIEQFWGLPELLERELDDYVFRLGHYSDNWIESVLYAIPKELYKP